ncbi:DUF7144 family membrane protein [Cryptosporangium aurantiacum]|uniref:DUF7144 domain-containing protein n=1 Tax=Cryptosporangium aurantiacum TaxID=134849 RepID=A0A1M7Q3X6_9ACTN|nr:hypothetical protein [Cryptosporangium aurantiacum]SHN24876.1 hypothetical protein SAMN05443668_104101 [Cryptosporangium aurantiacum]
MAIASRSAWTGWIVFAGAMLIVVGVINAFQGFIALIWDERVVVTSANLVVVDLTGWAWTILLFGLLLLAVGAALLQGQTWARVTAIILVGLHAVVQIAWLGAYPVWSLLMIGLDTVILFALTAKWSEALGELRPDAAPRRAGSDTVTVD